MIVCTFQIARRGHAECSTEGRTRVTSTVAIVLTFTTQQEAIETFILADRVNLVLAACEHFVDIALMSHIKDKLVLRRVKHAMHGDG